MCGRFVASRPVSELAELLDASEVSLLASDGSDPTALPAAEQPALPLPSWNVAPTVDVWGLTARRDEAGDLTRRLRRYHWGLVPSWSKSPAAGVRSFNARAETVMERPMFRNALERRRCIIPADAFYEWRREGGGARGSRRSSSIPWCFRAPDDGILAFAGLWEFWREKARVPSPSHEDGPDGGRRLLVSCTIITTDANAVVAPIHDRMPVVLPPEAWGDWLADGPLPGDLLAELLLPPPDDSLVSYRVAPLVNDVRIDGPELVVPYDGGEPQETAANGHGLSRLFDLGDLGAPAPGG